MSGKRKRNQRKTQSPVGIPGIELDLGLDWLLAYVDQSRIAQDQFQGVIEGCIVRLLELALPLRERDTETKNWAGRVLAQLHVSLEAHKWKLVRENPAYKKTKATLGKTRSDVLVPKSEISGIVQEELRRAMEYQFKLQVFREKCKGQSELRAVAINKEAIEERMKRDLARQIIAGETRVPTEPQITRTIPLKSWPKEVVSGVHKNIEEWVDSRGQEIARERANAPSMLLAGEVVRKKRVRISWEDAAQRCGIPREYWNTGDLPYFCDATKDEWWEWLWSCILKYRNILLPGRDPSKVKKQIRDAFLALVGAREDGTF
jgi:hypothetical protein